MESDEFKQLMYAKSEGFWRIVYTLEYEIQYYWTQQDIGNAYEKMKHLYAFVCNHFKDKNADEYFRGKIDKNGNVIKGKFKEIEELLYNPHHQKYSTLARAKKLTDNKKASDLMFETYIELKKNMKNSDMELYYGTPMSVQLDIKRQKNINKVFGDE